MKFNFDTPESAQVIFSDEANKFVQDLHSKFGTSILDLLSQRIEKQAKYNAGILPNFLQETKDIRNSNWQVREIPKDLKDRRF